VSDNIGIGFIGAGGIARHHMRQLQEITEAKVVAMADPSEASITRMRETYPETSQCLVFKDYRQMLGEVPLDAVEIHTPHTLHFRQAMDCLDKGLHVLIEKPMTTTTDDAEQLIEASKSKSKVVLVSYQRHYQPVFRFVKQKIAAGDLGPIQYIALLLSQNWYVGTKGKWRQAPALSGGGQLNDSGSHIIDIMLWTTELTPETIYASMENYDAEVDIDSAITVRFTSGAQATISIIGNGLFWWEDFSIWGSKAAILYRNKALYHQAAGEQMLEVEDLPEGSHPDQNFINAILGKEEVESPPE